MNTTIIGVAGGTASGKSTLVKKLQEAFEGESVITLCHDYYYKAHDDLSFEARTKLNYDHPGAFDTDMMIEDIIKLNLPTAVPYVFEFDENLNVANDYFLGNPEEIKKLMEAVANQGKKK